MPLLITSLIDASLIWMFCQKTLHLKIKEIHHKTLRITHQSNTSYRDLLECNGSISIHQGHLQFLLTEIYKITVTTNPRFMWDFFRERNVLYNLRKGVAFFPSTCKADNPWDKLCTFSWHTNLESATTLNNIQ